MLRCFFAKVDASNEGEGEELERGDKGAEPGRNTKVGNGGTDVKPGALVADKVEEIQRKYVRDGHNEHEERARRNREAPVEDSQVRADDGKRYQDLQDEERALRERIEDGDQAVDRVKGKGGDGGDVSGAEKGRLEKEEKEKGDTGIRGVEDAITPAAHTAGFGGRVVVRVDPVLEEDPGKDCHGEEEVEEAFVRNGEDHKGGRECQENNHEPVKVVAIGIQPVGKWQRERSNCLVNIQRRNDSRSLTQDKPSDDLVSKRKSSLGLQRCNTRPRHNDREQNEANLGAHDRASTGADIDMLA